MTCPTCPHGPRPCAHPLVMPFTGEPPTRLGSSIVDWCADHLVPGGTTWARPRDNAPPCPGATPRSN